MAHRKLQSMNQAHAFRLPGALPRREASRCSKFAAKPALFVSWLIASWMFVPTIAHAQDFAAFAPLVRVDFLRWSIAATSGVPDILSELTWSSVISTGATVAFTGEPIDAAAGKTPFAEVSVSNVVSGQNRDSDYLGSSRSGEYLRSINTSAFGTMIAARFGVSVPTRASTLSVLFAQALDIQLFTITGGTQYSLTNGQVTSTTPSPGLQATYETFWSGPWFGLRVATPHFPADGLSLRTGVEIALYGARADWINRIDFSHPVSFRHTSAGVGADFSVDFRAPLSSAVSVRVSSGMRAMTTTTGMDRLYYPSGTGTATFDSVLNPVLWFEAETSVGLGISY